MDWGKIGDLIKGDAPALAELLIGALPIPGANIMAKVAGGILASKFGVEATPEAVSKALLTTDPTVAIAKIQAAQADAANELEAYKIQLADVQSARDQTIRLATSGTSAGETIAYGAPIVSVIVISGFALLSFFAVKPEYAAISDKSVILYLLGSWNSLAAGVVAYWIGSSAGSRNKDKVTENLATQLAKK